MQSVSDTRRHTVHIRLPLSRLRPGETGCVVCIDPASPLLERLGDFGLMQGTHIRCERVSLFGDPVAYRILPASDAGSGTVIALRRRDAGVLTVRIARHVRLVARKEKGLWG